MQQHPAPQEGRRAPSRAISPARSYALVNLIMLGLALYGLARPTLQLAVGKDGESVLPACPSLRLLNRPCPLCGVTRGLAAVMRGRPEESATWNVLSGPLFAVLILEVIGRTLIALGRPCPKTALWLARRDFIIHAALFAMLVAYTIAFNAGLR